MGFFFKKIDFKCLIFLAFLLSASSCNLKNKFGNTVENLADEAKKQDPADPSTPGGGSPPAEGPVPSGVGYEAGVIGGRSGSVNSNNFKLKRVRLKVGTPAITSQSTNFELTGGLENAN